MRIGHLAAATLATCGLVLAQRGLPDPESPGLTVAGDFDGDGCDDVLVIGLNGKSATYYGQKTKPWVTKGRPWVMTGFHSLADVPATGSW